MTGQTLKDIMEDVADNLFNKDPYYQQGGDMVRVGGMGYTIDPDAGIGSRISGMTVLKTGEPVEATKEYAVAGWASVNEGTEGPPIWQVVEDYLARHPAVQLEENRSVKVKG
jgi:sulfur-oxidizing protein SoxB